MSECCFNVEKKSPLIGRNMKYLTLYPTGTKNEREPSCTSHAKPRKRQTNDATKVKCRRTCML